MPHKENSGEKKNPVKGVYRDCPYDDGVPNNEADCGEHTRYVSVTDAELIELISEAGIEGLVHQEYTPNLKNSNEGEVGYAGGVTVTEFIAGDPEKGKLCSIYWNEVPLIDKDNHNYNYADIDIETNQQLINTQGFVNKRVKVINERIKGSEENTTSHHRHYKIHNKHCSQIVLGIKMASLGKVDRYKGTRQVPNDNYGELLDSSVTISFYHRAIYTSHIGTFSKGHVEIIKGNFTTPYARDVVLNVPLIKSRNQAGDKSLGYGDFLGWEIQIIRNTPEPTTPDTKNATILDTITEKIEHPLMAPNSYLIRSQFSAEYFSQLPDRAYDVKLQKVQVPSNYNPITKRYDGVWTGTFKAAPEWTDNPAWCFYDLVKNKRYGLGKYIDHVNFDKWTLYEISKYCDTLVSDGNGGLEPRFTCNILIQTREDAFQVLNDMASIFRAIVYYSAGNIYAVQDSLKDSVFQFTNSNVEGGEFNYATTSAKVRHTVAIVRYNDKDNFYKPAVEYVDDVDGIRRYGIREKEISAFGCTSRGQALRLGRWVLATERLETETVTFVTGNEGSLIRPGDVFTISDSHRLMKRRGGRVLEFTRINNSKFTILLDSKLAALDDDGDGEDGDDKGRNYQLTLSAPSFFYDPSQTELVDSSEAQYIRNHHVQKFTVTNEDIDYDSGATGKSLVTVECDSCLNTAGTEINLGEVIDKMSWSILGSGIDDTAGDIQEKLNQDKRYRAINIGEKEINKYEISAAEYREEKYQEIDQALTYENTITFDVPSGPTEFQITNPSELITPNTRAINYEVVGPANNNGLSYYAIFAKEGSDFSGGGVPDQSYLVDRVYSIATPIGKFIPSKQATYYFRAYAVNSLNQYSTTGGQTGTGYTHNTANPGTVDPIKDVIISSLRISNDTGANVSGTSDPVAGAANSAGHIVDEYDGGDLQLAWKTNIPNVQGINIAFEFDFRIRIYKGIPETGTLLKTIEEFKPVDWDLSFTTFELPLSDIIELTKTENSGSVDLYDAYRDLSIVVDAHDGNTPRKYSSEGSNASGYDILYVSNPAPRKASSVEGFIDINGHVKVFNVDRPMDARAVYIIAAKKDFDWGDFKDSRNDSAFAFHPVKISPIGSEEPVFEMDPAFKTDDMTEAHVSIAYFDDFDEDILAYATENGIRTQLPSHAWDGSTYSVIGFEVAHNDRIWKNKITNNTYEPTTAHSAYWEEIPWYNEKTFFEHRMSDAVEFKKVTPEVMDLIGEGWKAWVKIDIEGKWYGRNVHCVLDVTDNTVDPDKDCCSKPEYTTKTTCEANDGTWADCLLKNASHKGYLPFYCGRRIPLIEYQNLYGHDSPQAIWIGADAGLFRNWFSAGCLYYLPKKYTQTYPNTYTNETVKIGGYFTPTDANKEYWTYQPDNQQHPYYNHKFAKSFKRFRVYFKKNPNGSPKFQIENAAGGYWVMGMNVNDKPYFNQDILTNIKRIPDFAASDFDWETHVVGGAFEALGQQGDDSDDTYIGGSDAFFNYHSAGFVQGWGGLAKEQDYFDVHMGHMIDGSYLKESIFFIMASSQDRKDLDHNSPCGEPS